MRIQNIFLIIFLGMLLTWNTTTEQIVHQENADTTKIVAVQKMDTLESGNMRIAKHAFFNSLVFILVKST